MNKIKLIIPILGLLLFLLGMNARPIEQPQNTEYEIRVVRTSENSNSITGELYINNEFVAHTLELPWKDNKFYVSSIPIGTYGGFLRFDKNGDVGLKYWRIELTGTSPRTVIQIHRGTVPGDVQGCIVVGEKAINGKNKLENTKDAFDRLKSYFPNYSPIEPLQITVKIEYTKSQTIFKMKDKPTEYFIYAGKGIWSRKSKIASNNIRYKELFRDNTHIWLEGTHNPDPDMSITLKWKIPINGGEVQSQADGGNWRKVGQMFREN